MQNLAKKEDINDCILQAIDFFKSKNPHFNNFKLCIPWSAGSGKTSAIIDFIAEYWRLGIIYSAGTIEELEIVYTKLLEKMPIRHHNKIFRFHSKRPDWDEVKDNPDLLKNYPVLMITHPTLSTMLPSYLVSRKQGYSETRPKDSVRRYCITDEKAIYSKEFTISKEHMGYLKLLFQNTDIEDIDFLQNYSKLLPLGLNTAENVLQEFKGNNVKLPTINDRIVENHIYGRTVRLVTELLYPKIEQVGSIGNLTSPIYAEDTSIVYDISNIEINHINFDGTGDIIFNGSNSWFVAKNKFPYKFSGEFNLIQDEVEVKRLSTSTNTSEEFSIANNIKDFIDSVVNNAIKSIKLGNKPLIVTWKDLTHTSKNSSELSNSDFKIKLKSISNIEKLLLEKGYTKDKDYYLTHWYSGETRATNRFKDANEIWLYQTCFLPQSELSKLRKVFDNETLTIQDLFVAEIVQAIYRTSVRCGGYVKVYFNQPLISSIIKVKDYLGLDNQVFNGLSMDLLDSLKIRKNLKEDIKKLADFFGDVSSLKNSNLEIDLDTIFSICPRYARKKQAYSSLITSLKDNLNCILTIH